MSQFQDFRLITNLHVKLEDYDKLITGPTITSHQYEASDYSPVPFDG